MPISKPSKPALKKGGVAAATLAAILASIYAVEGGYVNHKADRGGPTNFGVTQQVARSEGYLGDMRYFPKHCYGAMSVCADGIYTERYIYGPGFGPMLEIEPPVAKEIVDTGVNMGPAKASAYFQRAINETCSSAKLTVDGKIGARTIGAYQNCQSALGRERFCIAMLDKLDALQEARYRGIARANPSQRVFLKGWLNHRIGNVKRSECQS